MLRQAAERTGERSATARRPPPSWRTPSSPTACATSPPARARSTSSAGWTAAPQAAVEALRALSRPVVSRAEKAQVATISAHNDAGDRRAGRRRHREGRRRGRRHRRGGQGHRDRRWKWSRGCSSTAATCRRTSSPSREDGGRARGRLRPALRRKIEHLKDLLPLLEQVAKSGVARCWSSPRTWRARRWRRWSSTGCAACSRTSPSRRPASAIGARRCCRTSPC